MHDVPKGAPCERSNCVAMQQRPNDWLNSANKLFKTALIARLMLKTADVLLLDEPTNDLDLQSLEVLESSMLDFPGALVLVTHDRYLLDRVSREILSLDGKGNARFFADLSQWEYWRAQEESENPLSAQEAPKPNPSAKKTKELREIEAAIHAAELALRQENLNVAKLKAEAAFRLWEELESHY